MAFLVTPRPGRRLQSQEYLPDCCFRHYHIRAFVEEIWPTIRQQSKKEMNSSIDEVSSSLLDKINSPSDLRKLEIEQLPELCAEIREFLISHLSVNPGHFASSMGAVDIIVALHYVFDTPADRLVWDGPSGICSQNTYRTSRRFLHATHFRRHQRLPDTARKPL